MKAPDLFSFGTEMTKLFVNQNPLAIRKPVLNVTALPDFIANPPKFKGKEKRETEADGYNVAHFYLKD